MRSEKSEGWIPLTTGGDDEKRLSFPTFSIGNPSGFLFGWIPAYYWRGWRWGHAEMTKRERGPRASYYEHNEKVE